VSRLAFFKCRLSKTTVYYLSRLRLSRLFVVQVSSPEIRLLIWCDAVLLWDFCCDFFYAGECFEQNKSLVLRVYNYDNMSGGFDRVMVCFFIFCPGDILCDVIVR